MKHFDVGSVVYFVGFDPNRHLLGYLSKKCVLYGIVKDNYTDGVMLQLVELKDTRKVDGVPIKDFVSPSPWRKLPKGWTWNTRLFEITSDDAEIRAKAISHRIDNPNDILEMYANGVLVDVCNNDHAKIEAEVDSRKGYRLVKRYETGKPDVVSVPYHEAYETWAEANAVVEAEEIELKRQADLSDHDWSVEQICRTIWHWQKVFSKTDAEAEKLKDFMLSLKNIEDVETRIADKTFQWKYCKNKAWLTLSCDV